MFRHLALLAVALVIDRIIGDPKWLWGKLPHPVVLFGKYLQYVEVWLNKNGNLWRICAGTFVIIGGLAIAILCAVVIDYFCGALGLLGFSLEALIASIFLAQKGLYSHVNDVAVALDGAGIAAGRKAVSLIVGRDPQNLDETGISRAAIESLAENSSDGVIAPAFWLALLGLPGLFAYKMLNTADSMIGHKTARYRYFGYASARLDDFANYIPARLTAALVIFSVNFTAGIEACKRSWKITRRDAHSHRSPNAGWPESAYAGGLNISLSGPRIYNGQTAHEPYQNAEGNAPQSNDITRALKLYSCSLASFFFLVLMLTALAYFSNY